MLRRFYIPAMILTVVSGCAELNGALGTVNSILGSANETIGGISGATGVSGGNKTYQVGNRETAQYKITGLTVTVFGIDPQASGTFTSRAGVSIDGTLHNKTNRRIGVHYSIPVYDRSGRYVRSVNASSYAPAKETAKIETGAMAAVDWASGERIDAQKIKISVQIY